MGGLVYEPKHVDRQFVTASFSCGNGAATVHKNAQNVACSWPDIVCPCLCINDDFDYYFMNINY